MNSSIVMGIDIGGTHITAALVNLKTSEIVPKTRIRRSVNSQQEAKTIINTWCEVIKECFDSVGQTAGRIGIAMPGPFDYEQGICLIKGQNKFEKLYKLNIKELIAGKINVKKDNILLMNDSSCFLMGELLAGAARGFKTTIGLTLGTGLGSASSNSYTVEDAALWEASFKGGIAEDYLSTRWFKSRYSELTGLHIDGVEQLALLAKGNQSVNGIFQEFGQNLAAFLTDFIHSSHPEAVILGGNIIKAHPLFIDSVKASLLQNRITIPLKITELNEDAALIGAAGLWKEAITHRKIVAEGAARE